MNTEVPVSREDMIWSVFLVYAQLDGKVSGESFIKGSADRAYIAAALKDAANAVDEALKRDPKPKRDYAKLAQRVAR
ncbi:hypothetical protein FKW31_03060 [Acetobacter sp. DmW_136]|uniref:hypothetical protein n=1 Tax=Acetobacter sp. DmW_136 TaxID=2591091 RepID=UPI001239176A|nr:hypothetical protein [Acetobacter sp. DmW_136]KAA8387640.1 hypothetical protein FKW31_03060 [Acetobacter sp. DmW_136]